MNETQTKKNTINCGKCILTAIILAFVIGGGVLGYFWSKEKTIPTVPTFSTCPSISSTPTPLKEEICDENDKITYATFSSPEADFTFEYPNSWVYEEETDPKNLKVTGWNFYESLEKKFEIPILAVISPLTEMVDFCSVGYKGTKTPYQLNTFPTNDFETFVTYEQCGGEYGGAYIYWQKGEYFANASLINNILKINLMNFYSGSEEGKKIAQHIAQSIKIK